MLLLRDNKQDPNLYVQNISLLFFSLYLRNLGTKSNLSVWHREM